MRRSDVQALVDRLGAEQLSEGLIRSVISALRALPPIPASTPGAVHAAMHASRCQGG